MEFKLDDRSVVITGAESGIGRAIALECAAAGASVVLAGLDEPGLQETRAMVERLGAARSADTRVVRTDIRDPSEIRCLFDSVGEAGPPLWGVVANAGIAKPWTPSTEVSLQDFEEVMSVNLRGTFLTLQEAAPVLVRQGKGGSMISTGSSTAVRVAAGLLPYITSKAGVHAMVQVLAVELGAHRIRVNCLVPGLTATPMTPAWPGYIAPLEKQLPLGEIARVEEHARIALFALSDAAPHMTGTLLKVDAGRTA